jgi:hypothetical protein
LLSNKTYVSNQVTFGERHVYEFEGILRSYEILVKERVNVGWVVEYQDKKNVWNVLDLKTDQDWTTRDEAEPIRFHISAPKRCDR